MAGVEQMSVHERPGRGERTRDGTCAAAGRFPLHEGTDVAKGIDMNDRKLLTRSTYGDPRHRMPEPSALELRLSAAAASDDALRAESARLLRRGAGVRRHRDAERGDRHARRRVRRRAAAAARLRRRRRPSTAQRAILDELIARATASRDSCSGTTRRWRCASPTTCRRPPSSTTAWTNCRRSRARRRAADARSAC